MTHGSTHTEITDEFKWKVDRLLRWRKNCHPHILTALTMGQPDPPSVLCLCLFNNNNNICCRYTQQSQQYGQTGCHAGQRLNNYWTQKEPIETEYNMQISMGVELLHKC